ncbi:MAG: sigma 54-interacting transcriptional regulator, partial [Planctomycetes bacterium]|nr:sigma 54-interacting transcriptional regulator [Planctomycetota bacterium]
MKQAHREVILFLDEIHRFSKSQQDVLLADVEHGLITLVGATTENPVFTVNASLISRSTLFRFEPLSANDITRLVRAAIADAERGFGTRTIVITDDAIAHWSAISDGDARRALTALEVAVLSSTPDAEGAIVIDREIAEESIQRKAINYSAHGDEHYDAISAMI